MTPSLPRDFCSETNCAELNAFYKAHHYEGRMGPYDKGMSIRKSNKEIVAGLRALPANGSIRIRHVYTAPSFRGKGLAKRLLHLTSEQFQNTEISLICSPDLVRLYTQAGFQLDEPGNSILTATEQKLLRSGQYRFMTK